MAGRFSNNPFVNEQEDPENSPENSCDSPRYSKTSPSSHQTSRRTVQKKVVSVPIRDVEGSRLKGETPPPSDSWAWRKYGQKPIKGSPYPRGYYRCSSSKGCPARKQVERSRVDPTMLVVTYSSDHNHPPPTSKNHHHRNSPVVATAAEVEITAVSTTTPPLSNSDEENNSTVFDLGDESLVSTFGFKWFSELESSTSSTMLESPILEGHGGETDVGAMIFSMTEEEDESLFADLGELPECSVVFRLAALEREEEERRRCNLAPWCGTTG